MDRLTAHPTPTPCTETNAGFWWYRAIPAQQKQHNMKYLSDYTEAAQTALFEKTGAFFAFSKEQFTKARKEGATYASLGYGMFCLAEKAEELINGLEEIQKEAIQTDIKENGKEGIIIRELHNHECFYTCDITSAVEAVEQYGYTFEDVQKAYRKERIRQNEQEEVQA